MTIYIGTGPILDPHRCESTDAERHYATYATAGHRRHDTLDRAAADDLGRVVERLAGLLSGPVDSGRVRGEVERELREARALCQARAARHHALDEQARAGRAARLAEALAVAL